MAEKEYIDKVAFNYAIREAVKKYPNSFYNGLEVARQIAHDFPAADVRPVEWIPVTERLPENKVTVLVVRKFLGIKDCPPKTYVETAEYCYGDWVADSEEYKIARSKHTDPLYWMPLPEPPKEG